MPRDTFTKRNSLLPKKGHNNASRHYFLIGQFTDFTSFFFFLSWLACWALRDPYLPVTQPLVHRLHTLLTIPHHHHHHYHPSLPLPATTIRRCFTRYFRNTPLLSEPSSIARENYKRNYLNRPGCRDQHALTGNHLRAKRWKRQARRLLLLLGRRKRRRPRRK